MNQQENFVQNLESKLYRSMLKRNFSKIIFVCIGTDKLVGDQFGPLVGEELTNRFQSKPYFKVYGTVEKPVHFLNAPQYAEMLKKENACTIAIDSAFSSVQPLGSTYVNWGGMKLGKAFQKEWYFPADINMKTVISHYESTVTQNFQNLLQCKKQTIKQLSFQVAEGIEKATIKMKR